MQTISMVYIVIILLFSPKSKHTELEYINSKTINLVQMSSPPLQVYHAINKYASRYDIPYKVAFGVARKETGYRGPTDLTYTYLQTSSTGAEGAMQFIPSTIRWLTNNDKLTKKQIRRNVDMNVKQSMNYLNLLFNRYKDWHISLGYYNTGYPIINKYATDII